MIAKENNKLNPFTTALVQAKDKSGITEIELCKKSKISSSHLHYILRGSTQPSIDLAIRLLKSLDVNFPCFFKELCLAEKFLTVQEVKNGNLQIDNLIEQARQDKNLASENIFGILFKLFRQYNRVTQLEVSEFTSYTVRSIQKVEAGTQAPNVMTALKMLCAVSQRANVDLSVFFEAYQEISGNIHTN